MDSCLPQLECLHDTVESGLLLVPARYGAKDSCIAKRLHLHHILDFFGLRQLLITCLYLFSLTRDSSSRDKTLGDSNHGVFELNLAWMGFLSTLVDPRHSSPL